MNNYILDLEHQENSWLNGDRYERCILCGATDEEGTMTQPGEQVSRYQIRGSSMLSDLADNIFSVERNENKERKLADLSLEDEERIEVRRQSDTRLHLLKQRHGTAFIGVSKLYFSPTSLRWYEQQQYIDRPFNEVVELAGLGGNHVTDGTA